MRALLTEHGAQITGVPLQAAAEPTARLSRHHRLVTRFFSDTTQAEESSPAPSRIQFRQKVLSSKLALCQPAQRRPLGGERGRTAPALQRLNSGLEEPATEPDLGDHVGGGGGVRAGRPAGCTAG